MEVTTDGVLGWTRVGVLLLGMAWAAWMDHKNRRVPNEHWIVWAKPAIFLWALDLMVQGADWTIYLTAFGVVAYASVAVFGRATFRDARAGSGIDRVFLLWYFVSFVGFAAGAIRYQATMPLDVILGEGDELGILWWKTASVFLVILIIDLAWRVRLLHGGADAKALMWVVLVFPSWATVPTPLSSVMGEALVALPVAFALLMWGGLAFLFIPFIMLILNLKKGAINSFGDLRYAWHATQISIDEVMNRHVWLLTTTMARPDGETQVIHRTRAPRRTPSSEQLQEQINSLKELNVERVWVSFKMPLLVFLFPAIVPMVLLGEPTALVMNWLG
ncbi:MAG TPA: A24 family peptidase C-terminal domain-containing protein [Poseidonia sp.]|nr:A24 family peptidase C-terminal domain-containing protein [Poseidonia sp.]